MNSSAAEFFTSWKTNLPKLRAGAPDVARAFGGLHAAVMKDGKLAARDKELIALAVGLAQGCSECIFLHAEGALKAGASREQVLEAAGVAVMMAGGPAFVHLPQVLEAVEQAKSA